jgi:dihydrofolate reductase
LEAGRAHDTDIVYVVGGGSVYRQFLPRADELILSELDEPYAGDTTFPAVDWGRWREIERERYDAFDIVTYVRISE